MVLRVTYLCVLSIIDTASSYAATIGPHGHVVWVLEELVVECGLYHE